MSKDNKEKIKSKKEKNLEHPPKYREDGFYDSVPGINTPGVELPAFNPPVPNRAWTEMRNGIDIVEMPEEDKRDLYLGNKHDMF